MSIDDKIKRFKEAMSGEKDPDVILTSKAILQGYSFFKLGINFTTARLRFGNHCKDCEYNVPDPVESMKEDDKQIPELSGRMCSHCGGCVLSYKTRQNIKKCEFWNE